MPLPLPLTLQRSVVKIVREKFLNEVTPNDEPEFQRFLARLYIFLVDQMHSSFKKVGHATCPTPLLICMYVRCSLLRVPPTLWHHL